MSGGEMLDPQKRRAVEVTVRGLLGGDESPKSTAQGRGKANSLLLRYKYTQVC